jgi:hypothetical protein
MMQTRARTSRRNKVTVRWLPVELIIEIFRRVQKLIGRKDFTYFMAYYRSSGVIGMASTSVMRTAGGRSILVDSFRRFLIQFNLAFDFIHPAHVLRQLQKTERERQEFPTHDLDCTGCRQMHLNFEAAPILVKYLLSSPRWDDVANPRNIAPARNLSR